MTKICPLFYCKKNKRVEKADCFQFGLHIPIIELRFRDFTKGENSRLLSTQKLTDHLKVKATKWSLFNIRATYQLAVLFFFFFFWWIAFEKRRRKEMGVNPTIAWTGFSTNTEPNGQGKSFNSVVVDTKTPLFEITCGGHDFLLFAGPPEIKPTSLVFYICKRFCNKQLKGKRSM